MSDHEAQMQAMVDGLGLAEPVIVEDVTLLTNRGVMEEFSALTEKLLSMGEGLAPTTQAGRDAHSRRDALHVELIRRRLM